MRDFVRVCAVLVCLVLAGAAPLTGAQKGKETRVLVRAIAHDAKIIGSSVGGARITIKDVDSGALLAEGVTRGSTGSTEKIIVEPQARHSKVFDTEGAAGFTATLELVRPTVVEISAVGPLGDPQAIQKATKTMLLVPGKDVLGEGVLLEIHGFTVRLEIPEDVAASSGHPLQVQANVTMTCGCPTQPGGLWDSNDIEIVARLIDKGAVVVEAPLEYTGTVNTYAGPITPPHGGEMELVVLAMDPKHANFGQVSRTIRVSR